MVRIQRLCLIALTLAPWQAFAHHGQDFLLLESPAVAHAGNICLIANGHAALTGDAEERAGFEPALLVGVSPRIAFELHAHAEKLAGQGWGYEATAPAIHVLLTDPGKHEGFKAGISAEYEVAAAKGGRDNVEVRLTLENSMEEYKWAGNLIASRERGGGNEFAAALGFRHGVRSGLALGAEGQRSLRRADGAQLLAGAYVELDESRTIKFAIGGLRDETGGIQPVAHVGLVLRLH